MIKIKKWFMCTLLISIVCLIVGQILLLNESIKSKISTVYRMESKYVYSEQQMPKGSIEIEISQPEKGVYLLQNGEPIAELNQKKCNIDVFDNTVFEIDGRNCEHNVLVNIRTISENIDGYYEKEIVVEKNIVILGRFFIK